MQLQRLEGIVSSDIYKQLIALENFDKTEKRYLQNLQSIESQAIFCNDYIAQAEINNNIAKHFYLLSDYKDAITFQKKAITLAEKVNNELLLSRYYANLSALAIRTSYINKAVEFSFEGLKYKSTIETKIVLNMNLGICQVKRIKFS